MHYSPLGSLFYLIALFCAVARLKAISIHFNLEKQITTASTINKFSDNRMELRPADKLRGVGRNLMAVTTTTTAFSRFTYKTSLYLKLV
ncbi:hypothetical protein [Legionella sp. 227]|uniref:hypothetical protein n=1 Tax=Legionella sp. 227 TaxID=3367288 RepID=UPI00370D2F19